MKGYQLTFFTQQDCKHGREPLAEWLLLTARKLGIGGATIIAASEGYGHDKRIHAAHFFELADQPQEIVMAATEEEVSHLFDTLQQEGVHLFYMKTPIEFGVIGEP
ncbi:DUF190 domain-containing protein [Thiothrix winogradskyi]|uniref:DUF190 domain-containing protein n=1 Tax=Thiothrix winogradskyi TaxID=96472 RepID=A0ABY3T4J3_9GAMM|nr:DUF190 domain-containing protein [Thiothrix winogradskyi]UJS26343.1 DUF190 domain-containing protein [Thiothrix winogradskyi]